MNMKDIIDFCTTVVALYSVYSGTEWAFAGALMISMIGKCSK